MESGAFLLAATQARAICRTSGVGDFIRYGERGIYELTTDNQKIFVTAEHPFYVEGKGWVKVKNIEVGDVLKTKNVSIERVTNIKGENYEGDVYNIEVEGNHNYFVTSSNILVHNK